MTLCKDCKFLSQREIGEIRRYTVLKNGLQEDLEPPQTYYTDVCINSKLSTATNNFKPPKDFGCTLGILKSKQYGIWSEGYVVSGTSAKAHFHGVQEANSFQEACDLFFADKGNDPSSSYDSKTLSFWGCTLFDNKEDAEKAFG